MPKYTERQNGTLEPLQLASAFTNRSQNWRSKNNLKSLKKGKPKKEPNGKPDGTKRKRKHGDDEQDGDGENQEPTSKKQRTDSANQQEAGDEHQAPAPTLKRKNPYDQQEGDEEYQDPAPKRQRGALDAQQPRPRLTANAPNRPSLAQNVPGAVQEDLTAVADPSFALGSFHGNGGGLVQDHQFAQCTYGHALYEAAANPANYALLHENPFAQFAPEARNNALHADGASHGDAQYHLGNPPNGRNHSPLNHHDSEYPSPPRTNQGAQPYNIQRSSMGQTGNDLLQTPQGSNHGLNSYSYQQSALGKTQNGYHQPTPHYSEYVQPQNYQNPYMANPPLAGPNLPSAYGYVQDRTAQPLTPSNSALGAQGGQMNGQGYPLNQLNIYDTPTPSTYTPQLNGYQPVGTTQAFTPVESPSMRPFRLPSNQGYPNSDVAPPQSSQQVNPEQSVAPSAPVPTVTGQESGESVAPSAPTPTVTGQEPDNLTVQDPASTGLDSEAAQEIWIQEFVADSDAHHQTFEENLAELLTRANREHDASINPAANQEGQNLPKHSEAPEQQQQQSSPDGGNKSVPSPEVGPNHVSEASEEHQPKSALDDGNDDVFSQEVGADHATKASEEQQQSSAPDGGDDNATSSEADANHASNEPLDLQTGSQNAEVAHTLMLEEPVAIDITDWEPEQIDYRYLSPMHENQQGELDECLEVTLEAFGAYHGADNVPFVSAMSYLDAIRILRSENTQFFIDRDAPIQPLPYRGPWFGALDFWRFAEHVRG